MRQFFTLLTLCMLWSWSAFSISDLQHLGGNQALFPLADTIPATTSSSLPDGDYVNNPAMQQFIAKMHSENGFAEDYLTALFRPVKRNDDILKKVYTPAEGLSWEKYRAIFLTDDRINNGVAFWIEHDSLLRLAQEQYGVDPAYIVAILGVETAYGKITGKYNVLQSLTTLGFDYPERGKFYQKQLGEFLLLLREEGLSPDTLKGSYAGAMGMAQFIAGSYRFYAVDFDKDGKRDLWQPADAIGSVAHYFNAHKWLSGHPVATRAIVSGNKFTEMADTVARKPRYTMAALAAAGVTTGQVFNPEKVNLVKLKGAEGEEYWLTAPNFYVITRYNHSHKYAMAVHQLAEAIAEKYLQQ